MRLAIRSLGAAATMVILLGSTLAARTAMNVDPLVAIRDQ